MIQLLNYPIILITLSGSLLAQGFSFRVSSLHIQNIGKAAYTASFSVIYNGERGLFEDSKVYITTEGLIVNGKIVDNKVSERDFLFSSLNYDLNGDGDLDDIYKTSKVKGTYYINSIKLKPLLHTKMLNKMTIFHYLNNSGKEKIYHLRKNGPPFIIYDIHNNMITIGLKKDNRPVKIEKFPNPNVQIMVMKVQEKRFTPPRYEIRGEKNYISYTNEKVFNDQMDQWVSIIWAVKKIDITKKSSRILFKFTIQGAIPPFIISAIVNCSVVEGMRMRTLPRTSIVSKP